MPLWPVAGPWRGREKWMQGESKWKVRESVMKCPYANKHRDDFSYFNLKHVDELKGCETIYFAMI